MSPWGPFFFAGLPGIRIHREGKGILRVPDAACVSPALVENSRNEYGVTADDERDLTFRLPAALLSILAVMLLEWDRGRLSVQPPPRVRQ